MELRHLRYFLAVAEELNFTRAARRLNIAQPPLTQQIKSLEKEVGAALFDRSAYRIQLTQAGKVFANEASRILGDARNAVALARSAAQGSVGYVRVGITESASFNPKVTATLRNFRHSFPDVEISLEEQQSSYLANGLRENRIDAAFLRPPLKDDSGLAIHMLAAEEMVVALPSTHCLAQRQSIHLRDLSNEGFILYPRVIRPGLADAVVLACERVGFTPRVVQYAPQLSSTINLVAASLGISIVPVSMRGLQPAAVSYVPLQDVSLCAHLAVALRVTESAPAVLKFVEAARGEQASP